ncbi:sugar transferase [Roseisalinus antarcticus]|uniref:Putative sugar transferase EpsL n=1 Tax=Roseisalinus antarcticus TaxID=254357 RepID=A0A1Y5TWV5_9RHOB|nr:sugar transferase [Roseisalinus antarcticus]SLN72387.1 putative sugar transferase EpsL [Roseisalinus antarcticus]
MTWTKRVFDICAALFLGLFLVPVVAVLFVAIRLKDGAPVFYVSERMRTPEEGFGLVKFRSMTVVEADSGVSGGDKSARITPTGRFLRRTRLDEVPQLWNVLRGDISFVGPRPPLRQYVEQFPELYAEVLKARPGITGLATLVYHSHEEALLARCKTTEKTDAVYARACVPRKATLDMIYRDNRTLCWDVLLMWRTVSPRR